MSTSPNRATLWLGAAMVVAATAALGWKIGSATAPVPDKTAEAPPSGSAADHALARARARSFQARQRVSSIARAASPEQRLRATIELANTLPTSEFPEWVNGSWFDFRSGFELTVFRRIIEERWRLEDPEGFIAWCLEEGQGGPAWMVSNPKEAALPILTDWALNSPDRLRAFFAKHPDDALEAQLVASLAAAHPQMAVARLKEMLGRGTNPNRLQSAIGALATAAPEAVEAILDELPASLRMQAESALTGQRLAASFDEEIRALWERPDGWRLFSNNLYGVAGVGDKLLAELPNLPDSWRYALSRQSLHSLFHNSDAEPWVRADLAGAGFTAEQAARIRTAALTALSSKDPGLALELLPEVEMDERQRLSLIASVFRRARSEPEQAERWMAMLATEEEREAARSAMSTEAATTNAAVTQRNFRTPEEWIEGALGDNQGSMAGYYLSSALERWSPQQVADLAARFRDLPAEQKDAVADAFGQGHPSSLSRSAPAIQGEIVRHLIEAGEPDSGAHPSAGQTTRLASSTAVHWVIQNADAARAWVESLPEGEPKLWAQMNMAAAWADYDPEAVEHWIATLPSDTQAEVRGFMESPER